MSASQRRKGHDFERWVARELREALGLPDIHRGQQGDGAREPDVAGVPGVWIECQCSARPTPEKKLEQAERDAPCTIWPVAVIKAPRKTPFVALRLWVLVEMTTSQTLFLGDHGSLVTMRWLDFVRLLQEMQGILQD